MSTSFSLGSKKKTPFQVPEKASDLLHAACCLCPAYWLLCPVMRKHSQVPDSMHCSLHLVRPLPLNALVVLQLHKEAEAEKKKVSCPAMPTNDGPPICQGALSTHCMWGSV